MKVLYSLGLVFMKVFTCTTFGYQTLGPSKNTGHVAEI